MADDPGQNEFAERLRRIEERRQADLGPQVKKRGVKPGAPSRPTFEKSPIDSHQDVRLRNGIIWVCILAVVGGAGYYGYQGLPDEYKNGFTNMASTLPEIGGALTISMDTTNGRSRDVPVRAMYRDGPALQSPALLTVDGYDLDVQAIAANFSLATAESVPQQVMVFDRNPTCTLRRPRAGDQVVNIRMAEGSMESAVLAFPDSNIANWMTEYAKDIVRNRDRDITPFVNDQMKTVDVFLTDTSAPLHVVLQNTSEGIIWNLQPAPGVTIAHVALIGPHAGGVAGLSSQTTYEALQFGDFAQYRNENWETLDGGCMAVPLRPRQTDLPIAEDRQMSALAVSVESSLGEMVSERNAAKDEQLFAFETWYQQTLGVDAGTNLVSANHAAHVLAGPMPATPYDYRPITESVVYLTRADNVIAGPTEARNTAVVDLKLVLLTAASGGNADWANPPMMEVATQ